MTTQIAHGRPIALLASGAVITLVGLVVAACGGGSAATAVPATTTNVKAPAVRVANTAVGPILADSHGRTLYLFKADVGTRSTCTGACATAWPPLRSAGNATAAGRANPRLFGTAPRPDGAAQVTYNGHPLYLYVGDRKPGDINGQGLVAFGAAWYAVSPAGQPVTTRPTNSPGASHGGY